MADLRHSTARLLSLAGVRLNGSRPFDPRVKDDRCFARLFSEGSLGVGEAYMDDWWEVPSLDEFFNRVLRANLQRQINGFSLIIPFLKAKIVNLQSKARAFQVGEVHYDLGNEFF